jgi:hypothetical protein
MIEIDPITLEGNGVRLEPLAVEHHDTLGTAAADGRLWELWFKSVPEPNQVQAYIVEAIAGQKAGHMLPWVVRELTTDAIIGSTRIHDIAGAAGHPRRTCRPTAGHRSPRPAARSSGPGGIPVDVQQHGAGIQELLPLVNGRSFRHESDRRIEHCFGRLGRRRQGHGDGGGKCKGSSHRLAPFQ